MKQNEVFGSASWITKENADFPLVRRKFSITSKVTKATLYAAGLGFMRLYMNGEIIAPYSYLPFSSDYEARTDYPKGEIISGHHLYVPVFDVTSLLKNGDNLFSMWFGGGWYCFWDNRYLGQYLRYYDKKLRYGDPKAIYRLIVETENGIFEITSSTNDLIAEGGIDGYCFTCYENRDLNMLPQEAFSDYAYDDSTWQKTISAKPLDTEYSFTKCPADTLIHELSVVKNGSVWDCGINTTGMPVIKLTGRKGEKVCVWMSEQINDDGTLDEGHIHGQHFEYTCDGTEKVVHPEFTWFGFRYFRIDGPAEPVCVSVVHMDVPVTAKFESSDETLNYLYRTYLNSQLTNLHAGLPSDCPHIERRGYTGDGELTCHAAMTMLGAEEFYRKWIQDISDCQDKLSGHIQYTAPYINSGGGPGAWGCAIVEVPWQFYRHYGDAEPMKRLYPQMKEYFRFMEEHSDFGLVTSDMPGNWCLGDWCSPDRVLLPPPFVNNCYYIKSLKTAIKIARITGNESDIPLFDKRIEERQKAIKAAYFTFGDGNFCANLQGANAFAVDAGAGNEETYEKMVRHYRETGVYDTGICGTDVVTRVLFEHGDADVAYKLLTNKSDVSFARFNEIGATTLYEYWPEKGRNSRSLNHPMFGAVTAYLFEYILGIRQTEDSCAYRDVVISPCLIPEQASGSQKVPAGEIRVSWEKNSGGYDIYVTIPDGIRASFNYKETKQKLNAGENFIRIAEKEAEA